ncbi:MAG: hypothetical protein M3033_09230 [Acidobacteriota bacterium]|nr:hypothetical protein [Acidobacteriota bacterium]
MQALDLGIFNRKDIVQFHWVIYLFGGFLIITGIKMIFSHSAEKNFLIRAFKRFIPVTSEIEGRSFFVRRQNILHATPLFIALLFLEATDVIFAVDSVPAIFSTTSEPLIVFTSNIFAILGLRSMYLMLAGAIDKFHLLKYGLLIVLIFVGLKMVWLNDIWRTFPHYIFARLYSGSDCHFSNWFINFSETKTQLRNFVQDYRLR